MGRGCPNHVGFHVLPGKGVAPNLKEALVWYQKAAEHGDPKAQTILGMMHEDGEGLPRDPVEAVRWFHLAAEQGDVDAQPSWGRNTIWARCGKGSGRSQKWLRRAAAQGDVDSQAKLGALCYLGEGAPRNMTEALKWFLLAAVQGDAYARAAWV